MCFSHDDSYFPPDPSETSETTPTPSAPNAAELAAARASGVMTRRRSRSMDSGLYNRPIRQQEYHQPAQTLHDATPYTSLNLTHSPHNSSQSTTIALNQSPSSQGHFIPYIGDGSPASSSSTNFTQTFPHRSDFRNMYADIRTLATSNQRRYQYPPHPPGASPHVGTSSQMAEATAHPSAPTEYSQFSERHGQFFPQPASTQEAGPSSSPPGIYPSVTASPRRQTSSSPKSSRHVRRNKNKNPCRRCKRSHLRCEVCPNIPDLCINCQKRGRKRCPTPEPQPSNRGSRRRTGQRNQTVIPSPSPALGCTENPDNDVDADSTSGGLYSPPPYPPSYPPPSFTTMETQISLPGSANWMAHNPIVASTSRPSTYSNENPLRDSHPLVSPSVWSLLAPPASGVQRLDERFGHDGRDNSRARTTSPEPASPHSQTSHSQPGSPSHSILRHTPGS